MKQQASRQAEDVLNHYKEIVRGVRNVRAEMNVPNSRKGYDLCSMRKFKAEPGTYESERFSETDGSSQ